MNNRFVLNRTRGKLMGVCAGLADWLQVDVLIVRLVMFAALFVAGPVTLLLYVLTGWLATDER